MTTIIHTPIGQSQESANAAILQEIAALEAKQPRAVREALLSMDGAIGRLQTIEDQIAELRAQLV